MATVDLKHTLRVDRDAWFVRFYVWLWQGDLQQITFCKLFWAYVFALPGLILRALLGVVVILASPFLRRADERKAADALTVKLAPQPASVPRNPTAMQRILRRIEQTGARLVFTGAAVWDFASRHKRFNRTLLRGAAGLGLVLSAGLAAAVVYLAVTYVSTALLVVAALGALIFASLVVLALHAFGALGALWNRVLTPFGRGAKGGALGLVGVMKVGYGAVKSNTCPRIEVTGVPRKPTA